MENLRNFVILQFHDGLEIVSRNWRIYDNNFFYPVGVKNRNDYFKLLNTMVRPGYNNDKYEWLPLHATKIYGSEDVFGKAMSKLASLKYYKSVGETDAKKPYNGHANKYVPPPEGLSPPISENRMTSSEPVHKLLKFITPVPGSMEYKPPADPLPLNFSTTDDGAKEFSAGGAIENVPTTSARSSTATINHCSKKESDVSVIKLSTSVTPCSGSTELKPFSAVRNPLKNTIGTEHYSGGPINYSKTATSVRSAPSLRNSLIPQLGMSVPPSNVPYPTNILYQKIVNIEKVLTSVNLRVSRSLANQDKIISLIEKQNRKTSTEKLVDKVVADFEDHFTSNFPLRSMEDLLELEKLLIEKQYYKLLKTKLLSYSDTDLKSATVNILAKLFTSKLADKITLSANSNIQRTPTQETFVRIKLQNKKIYKLIVDVVKQMFKCNEEQIKLPIRSWLKHVNEIND